MMQTNGTGAFFVVLTILTTIVGFITAIVWLVIGWRAMRAHEAIAETLRERLGRGT